MKKSPRPFKNDIKKNTSRKKSTKKKNLNLLRNLIKFFSRNQKESHAKKINFIQKLKKLFMTEQKNVLNVLIFKKTTLIFVIDVLNLVKKLL